VPILALLRFLSRVSRAWKNRQAEKAHWKLQSISFSFVPSNPCSFRAESKHAFVQNSYQVPGLARPGISFHVSRVWKNIRLKVRGLEIVTHIMSSFDPFEP